MGDYMGVINKLDHKVTQDFALAKLAILTRRYLYFAEMTTYDFI